MTCRVNHKSLIASTLFAGMTFVLSACGQLVSDDAKMKLSKDVDCSTAPLVAMLGRKDIVLGIVDDFTRRGRVSTLRQ